MKTLTALLLASSTLMALVFSSVFSIAALAGGHAHGGIGIEQPWSRPTPPGTPVGVGYLVISNHGDKDVTLVSATTARAGHVSIHETLMHDGVMRMQPVQGGLAIPAGMAVSLKPHSYHLMLEQLKAPLKEGERIPVNLEFEGAEPIDIELIVQPLDAVSPGEDHSKHQMGH